MSNGLEQFFITNGRTGIEDYIDLLEIRNGFCINSYKPGKIQLKNGGTFADSPIADGRTLVDYRWSTIVDTLEYIIVSRDSDAYALASQIFDRLLIQAINYQAKRHGNPVYLGRRTKGETNITYAEIIAFTFSGESDFFNQPFSSLVNKLILSDRLTQAIEHGPWLENPPGQHTLVEAGNYQCLNLVRNSHLETFSGGAFPDWTSISTPALSQSREFVEEGFYAGVIESSAGTEGLYQDISQAHLLDGYTYTVQVRVYIEAGEFGIRATDFGAFTSPVVDSSTILGWHTLEVTKSLAIGDGMRISLEAIGAGSIGHVSWVKLCRYSGNVDSSGEEQPVITRDIFFNNQSVEQGITHMYFFDGATYTDNLLAVGPPFDLHGTTIGTAALYIGASNNLSRIFNNVVFNVGLPAIEATASTIIYQYWDGANWIDLDVRDNTDGFTVEGVNSVHWEMPIDWASVDLSAIAAGAPAVLGKWVRAILTAGTFTQIAEQQDRIPYAAINNYLEVAADQAIGVIPALAEIIEENTSDDSTAFPASDGASIRTILGLRSLSRGEAFRGIINLSDTGNPPWINVATTGSLSVLANYAKAPSGRIFQYTYVAGSIPGVLVPELAITLARSEARSFFGTFRAYLRIDDLSNNDSFRVQLQFPFSNGTNSSVVVVEETSPGEMYAIDLGEIKLPAGDPVADDLYDDITMYLSVEPDAAQTFKFIDFWLIPTDELLLDTFVKTGNGYKNGEYNTGLFSALQIDSIHDPRRNWRSLLQYADESYIVSSWQAIGGGPLILQPKQRQRYWFYNFNFGTEAGLWFGRPEIANRAEIHRNARYTGIRGDD